MAKNLNYGLTISQMTKRIHDREENIYKKDIISDVLRMYMEECRKAILKGERVQIANVGTIIPEVKVRIGNYNLPVCNRDGGNPPYTKLRMTRTHILTEDMNKTLIKNIDNGILGLEETPFEPQQLNILKASGYISDDEVDYEEE